ncbi:MAG: LysM peptidoglycan-binding domain-containing protein [Chloroflexi bacterium]|nr:MAG: LysM peptidoglycan-binding domain-containing protein [Chloroflexota bacterium]
MRVRLIPLLLLNVALSAAVAFGVITLMRNDDTSQVTERVVTFQVIITATPNPNTTPQVMIITATPGPGTPVQREIPAGALDQGTVSPLETVPPDIGTAVAAGQLDNLPQGCITHTIDSGEAPSIIAEQYGVSVFDVLAVNNLTEEDARFLQIGEILIIPLEGCPIEAFIQQGDSTDDPADEDATAVPGETTAPDATNSTADGAATPTPTLTLAPTAVNAQVEIVEVIGAGDITLESVVIRNTGNTTSIGGWTLTDADGNTYTFPADRRLFSGGGVTILTREGTNTPINLFWGQQEAILQPGDVLTLRDEDGNVQSTYRVP